MNPSLERTLTQIMRSLDEEGIEMDAVRRAVIRMEIRTALQDHQNAILNPPQRRRA